MDEERLKYVLREAEMLPAIADALNEKWLPREYIAEEHTHAGTQLEIDVATFERAGSATVARIAPSSAEEPPSVWQPPSPQHHVALAVPDSFEVRVLTETGGATLA